LCFFFIKVNAAQIHEWTVSDDGYQLEIIAISNISQSAATDMMKILGTNSIYQKI
jgi:hypothetical protein